MFGIVVVTIVTRPGFGGPILGDRCREQYHAFSQDPRCGACGLPTRQGAHGQGLFWNAQVLDPLDQCALTNPKTMKLMIEKSGQTEAALRQALAQMELFVVGPSIKGFAPNVNVISSPGTALPTDAQLHAQLDAMVKVTAIREESTAMGPVRVSTYTMDIQGTPMAAEQIYAINGGRIAIITVSARDAAEAKTYATTVLKTLRPS